MRISRVVTHKIVSTSPLGTDWAFELGMTGLGLGIGGLGTKGLGLGLDNLMFGLLFCCQPNLTFMGGHQRD